MSQNKNNQSSIGFFGTAIIISVFVMLSFFIIHQISPYINTDNISQDASGDMDDHSNITTIEPSNIDEMEEENPLNDFGGASDNSDVENMPSITYEDTLPTTSMKQEDASRTRTPPKSNSSNIAIPVSKGEKIGQTGLNPGTVITVVQSKKGNTVNFDTCTIAFSLRGKSGYPWAITAGHCGKEGSKVYTYPTGNTFSTAYFLGTVRYVSKTDKENGDWGAIRLNPQAKLPSSPDNMPNHLKMSGAKMGDNLCKFGATTGYNCGPKNHEDVEAILTLKNQNTQEVKAIVDGVNLCALPGDSGSPIFDNNGIVGILSSSSASDKEVEEGKCGTSSSAYYSPIGDVVSQIKANVKDIKI